MFFRLDRSFGFSVFDVVCGRLLQMKDGSVLVVSARSARGMAHQDLTKDWGVAVCLLDGLKVRLCWMFDFFR